jgi:GTP-binding protein HflX
MGLKPAQIDALRSLHRRKVATSELISVPLARTLVDLSQDTGRRIGVLIDRRGKVDKVIVGDANRVFLPDLGARRAGVARFRGVRLVLCPLRPEGLTEDELTDLTLLRLDAVVGLAVRPDGQPGRVQLATLLPPDAHDRWKVEELDSIHAWNDDFLAIVTDLETQHAGAVHLRKVEDAEKAILVGVTLGRNQEAQRSLAELERLAATAGLEVIDTVLQRRAKLDGRTCIGSGKLQELVVHAMHVGAEVLIFDRELTPSQLRNIATATELKVADRTQLILDIFAQHATTKAGKLQVELAQLRYRMPRLAIMPTAMSRLTGGIGGRGPGETKLEINKRRATERLTRLERDLERVGAERELRRRRRKRNRLPVVSIVGYTNAGKSTLLNRLTRSEVLVQDQLFATLDPTSRRFRFPEEREIIVTDTVGFIQDLPSTLVQAFKATLEELEEADVLLHVLDAADHDVEHHLEAVNVILGELELDDRQVLLAWNKADAASPDRVAALVERHGGTAVSALTGLGTEALLDRMERAIFRKRSAEAHPPEPARTDAG